MSWAWGLTSEKACFLEASDGGLSHRGGGGHFDLTLCTPFQRWLCRV